MAVGVPFGEIGGMTAEEIALTVQTRREKDKEFAQVLAWIIYNGAALTGVAVNDPKRFPKLEDAFPSLFERKEQQDWRIMKERVEAFSNAKKLKQTHEEGII
jgi:hypothetical protein